MNRHFESDVWATLLNIQLRGFGPNAYRIQHQSGTTGGLPLERLTFLDATYINTEATILTLSVGCITHTHTLIPHISWTERVSFECSDPDTSLYPLMFVSKLNLQIWPLTVCSTCWRWAWVFWLEAFAEAISCVLFSQWSCNSLMLLVHVFILRRISFRSCEILPAKLFQAVSQTNNIAGIQANAFRNSNQHV